MESGNKKNRKNKEGSRKKSPWDPLERKKLSFEDLKDLNKSFEEDLKVMLQEDKERAEKRLKDKGIEDIQKTPRKRRDSFQDMPVWKAKDIPDGWNPIENDLADE